MTSLSDRESGAAKESVMVSELLDACTVAIPAVLKFIQGTSLPGCNRWSASPTSIGSFLAARSVGDVMGELLGEDTFFMVVFSFKMCATLTASLVARFIAVCAVAAIVDRLLPVLLVRKVFFWRSM